MLRILNQVAGFSCAIALVMANVTVHAQGMDESKEPVMEEVEVVGYHIRRSDVVGPAPVTVVNRAELLATGFNTLAEVARALPVNVQGLTDGGSRTLPTSGTAQFNLRGLGVDATLVLLDGKRVAPHGQGQFNDYFVDLNSIPVAAIERIEILKDGASALYGSDAVAGVVNIVLRHAFDGIEVEAGYQGGGDGGYDEWSVFTTGGWTGINSSGVATLSLFEGEPYYAREHPHLSDFDYSDRGGANNRSFFSSPPTLLFFDQTSPFGFRVIPDAGCGQDANTSISVVIPGLWTECLFNPAVYTSEIAETRRIGATLAVEWQLSPDTSLFVDLFGNRNETKAVTGPTLISATPLDTPFGLPMVPAGHPDNPIGVPLLLGYRSLPSGARINQVETELARLVAGLEGRRGDWDWELAGEWSRSEVSNDRRNYVQASAFQAALFGAGGPAGDQFFNPFGLAPQNDGAVVDGFTVDVSDASATEEAAVDFLITGYPFEFAAGPLGIAVGAQFRRQDLSQTLDPLEEAGDVIGALARFAIDTDRDIRSVFGEFNLLPLDSVEAQFALRYEDYSDFGGTTNPKISLGWTLSEELLLRGSWGTSFRAPSFPELLEPYQAFTELVTDSIRCERTGAVEDCAELPYEASVEGNPDLSAEEGESWNVGLVWNMPVLNGLRLSIDVWEIAIDGRVFLPEPQFFVDQLSDDPTYVIRGEPTPEEAAAGIPGRLEFIHTTYLNTENTTTRGFDLGLVFQPTEALRFELMHTYLGRYEVAIVDSVNSLAGQSLSIFPEFDVPLPRNRAMLSASYSHGRHELTGIIRHTGGFRSPETYHEDGVDTGKPFDVGSWTILDISYLWSFSERSSLRLGCRNCLDEDPPILNDYLRGSPYDYRGSMINLRLSYRFR